MVGELPCALHHASHMMRAPQSPQHGKNLGRVSQLSAELMGAAVNLIDFRNSWTHGDHQHWTKRNQYVQLLLDTFGNEVLLHTEAPGCFDPMQLNPAPLHLKL